MGTDLDITQSNCMDGCEILLDNMHSFIDIIVINAGKQKN